MVSIGAKTPKTFNFAGHLAQMRSIRYCPEEGSIEKAFHGAMNAHVP